MKSILRLASVQEPTTPQAFLKQYPYPNATAKPFEPIRQSSLVGHFPGINSLHSAPDQLIVEGLLPNATKAYFNKNVSQAVRRELATTPGRIGAYEFLYQNKADFREARLQEMQRRHNEMKKFRVLMAKQMSRNYTSSNQSSTQQRGMLRSYDRLQSDLILKHKFAAAFSPRPLNWTHNQTNDVYEPPGGISPMRVEDTPPPSPVQVDDKFIIFCVLRANRSTMKSVARWIAW